MKKFFLLTTIIILSLGFSSCLKEGESNYVPKLMVYPVAKINSKKIPLSSNTDQTIKSDSTIYVGDTISFSLVALGYANALKTLDVTTTDNTAINIILADSVRSLFSDKSDFINGKLIMKDNIATIYFPFTFITKKEVTEYKMDFTLVSDADIQKVSNTSVLTFKFPIKTK